MASDSPDAAGGSQGRRVALLELLAQAQVAARHIWTGAHDAKFSEASGGEDFDESTTWQVLEAAASQSLVCRARIGRPDQPFFSS